ncbi:MAG: DinB family protein [Bacteroidetes bacterium]|mgnify:FL=1|nr:DinB family protein [Bacteroidota bacterium]
MAANTECIILADAFESTRSLTKGFLSRIQESLINDSIEINGAVLNSPYWITAHLAWAEGFLLLTALGSDFDKYKWLDEYGFGSNPAEIKTKPPYFEVKEIMDEIHAEAMKHLKGLNDEFLNEKNKMGIKFGDKDDNRIVIHHAIRHEPMHMGQLTWFMKSKGIQTV